MIYVVLGMHKSGTTLITQMLHHSGINMGEFDKGLGYTDNNQFERHITQEINRELLHGYLIPPLDYLLRRSQQPEYNPAGYRRNKDSIALVRYRALQKKLMNADLQHISAEVQKLNAAYNDWGFKDPRTCLTYLAWRRALRDHRLIIVYRHYSQLLERYRVNKYNIARLYRVLYSWTLHNSAILKHLDSSDVNHIVINYEHLMQGEEDIERLAGFLGRSLQDVRDPALFRNRDQRKELSATARLIKPFLPADPDQVYAALAAKRDEELDIPAQGSMVIPGFESTDVFKV